MTIRRGEEWGRQAVLGPGVAIVDDDAALGDHAAAALSRGERPAPVAVRSGDLARALGGGTPGRVEVGATLVEVPIDAVRVTTAEGAVGWWCAHLVARRHWWRGGLVAAVNGGFVCGRDVAPRAHPNDGRIDVVRVEASMRPRERLAAWRRAATGSHLPHPAISVVQVATLELAFPAPVRLTLDGRQWERSRAVHLEVVPDALTVLA